ncbi:MAG TPA: RDD family protein [Xenococcaceae cyanobacterium]
MRFFNRINLQTPESVELEFTLAGIGNRAYALAIDYLVLGTVLVISLVIAIFLSYQIAASDNFLISDNQQELLQWLWAIEALIFFSIYVGYFIFFETIWQGQTIGKKKAKIRVIADDGKPTTLGKSSLRALLRPVDDLLFIGVFFIALSKQEKRIGDLVAGTLVIQEEFTTDNLTFKPTEAAKQLALQLRIETDISRLSPENFAILRSYLQNRTQMMAQARRELARKLATQVKNIIELENLPQDTTADCFLEAVYLGYQQEKEN